MYKSWKFAVTLLLLLTGCQISEADRAIGLERARMYATKFYPTSVVYHVESDPFYATYYVAIRDVQGREFVRKVSCYPDSSCVWAEY